MSVEKRVKLNNKNIDINSKRIAKLESKIDSIQRPKSRIIAGDGRDFSAKLDTVENKFDRALEQNKKEKDEFIQSILDRLEALETENKALRAHVNGKTTEVQRNLSKFKSEVTPVINKYIAHRGVRDLRRNRR